MPSTDSGVSAGANPGRPRTHRLPPVRYMSEHSWKQPDSHGRNGTTTARGTTTALARMRRPRAVSADGGGCWTKVAPEWQGRAAAGPFGGKVQLALGQTGPRGTAIAARRSALGERAAAKLSLRPELDSAGRSPSRSCAALPGRRACGSLASASRAQDAGGSRRRDDARGGRRRAAVARAWPEGGGRGGRTSTCRVRSARESRR
jgi:hypothetical protein